MRSFSPTEESYGFNPDLLWSGLKPGCRATKSRRLRSELAKLSGVTGRSTWRLSTGLPAVFLEGLPWGSIGVTDNEWFAFLAQQPLLPKTVRHSATQPADKKDDGQALYLLTATLKPDSNKTIFG
jgi:hypothetical protein